MATESIDTTRLLLPIHAEDHVYGPESADFTLVEYGDYECPDCGRLFQIIRDLQATLGDRLRIVYRHYPVSGSHPHAQEAAEAAEAAGAVGDQADGRVHRFEAGVGEAEPDRVEDPVAVLAERAGELDEGDE